MPVVFIVYYMGCPTEREAYSKDIHVGPDGYASLDINPWENCRSFYLSVSNFPFRTKKILLTDARIYRSYIRCMCSKTNHLLEIQSVIKS